MKNPKFSFFLRNKPNTQNQFPIVLTITMGQDRTQVFTGQYVIKSKWNAQTKRVKGHDQETKTINDTLVTIATQARQVSNELLISGMPFNPTTIKEKIKYGFKKNLGTVEAYEIFLKRIIDKTRESYPDTYFGIALASLCKGKPHEPIRRAQRSVASANSKNFISADSDMIAGSGLRYDGCHISQVGAMKLSTEYYSSFLKEINNNHNLRKRVFGE